MERRPNQLFALETIEDALLAGHRSICVTSPTGGGKSLIMFDRIEQSGLSTALYTDRRMLFNQISKGLNEHGIDHGRRASGHEPRLLDDIQLCMIQTEKSRSLKGKREVHRCKQLLVDECFSGETEILTPHGSKRIEDIREGDFVYTATGCEMVESVFCKSSSDLYELEFDNGRAVVCTGDHPFFTNRGWKPARALGKRSIAYGPQDMRVLWEAVYSNKRRESPERSLMEQAAKLLPLLLEKTRKPDAESGSEGECEQTIERIRSQATRERRKRTVNALAAASDFARSWRRMGARSGHSNQGSSRKRISDVLQSRRWESGQENRNRDRWAEPQIYREAGVGLEKSRTVEGIGVVRVSRLEHESSRTVFNLRVSGHPSYFANGVLVHNCHKNAADSMQQIVAAHRELFPDAILIGFTATPTGIGHMYDHLIIAGTNSELRSYGALVKAFTYGPDEPDTKWVGKIAIGEGECGLAIGKRMEFAHRVFGRVVENYRILNPEEQPALLFAPGVAESKWFADSLNNAGISAAHIDGECVVIDGEERENDDDAKEELAARSQSGEIKIVCNRFVLREGIDWPWIYHGIFATVFGSLTSYIQAGGRLLRAHPSMDHVCIARDTPVLTDRGLVEIQEVTTDDLVWDGVEFVSHDGPACMGHKEVIEWDGLVATPEHKVHTKHGWTTIETAARERARITRTEFSGHAIRVSDYSDPHNSIEWSDARSTCGLLEVSEEIVQAISQDRKACAAWLRELPSQVWAALPGMDLSPCAASMAALQRPEGHYVSPLWRAWNQIQVFFGVRRNLLDCGESWSACEPQVIARSNRQRWTLRAWKSSLGECHPAIEESRQDRQTEFSLSSIFGGISRCWVRAYVSGLSLPRGSYREPDCRAVAETWDIVNAGPRHRFTAAGVLVGNCVQDHGGNWWRHGSLNADREWDLSHTDRIMDGIRQDKIRQKKEPEPIICPQCHACRASGSKCWKCGYQHTKGTRIVLQRDGSLREMRGDIFKKRRELTHSQKVEDEWTSRVRAIRKSEKPTVRSMTFAQLEATFAKDHHWQYAPRTLPSMPTNEADWFRPVREVSEDSLTRRREMAR